MNLINFGFELVDLEKVKKNDYNLMRKVYRENRKDSKYQIISIGELCNNDIITLKKGKTITREKVEEGLIPVIAGGKKSPYSHNESNYKGNIITISASGTAGYVWYHDYPIWASDCNVIFSNNESIINTKYLFYYLSTIQEDIYKMITGLGIQHLYAKAIKNINIPFLPIEEQHKLINNLEDEYRNIKEAKENIKSSEIILRKLLNSYFYEYFKEPRL